MMKPYVLLTLAITTGVAAGLTGTASAHALHDHHHAPPPAEERASGTATAAQASIALAREHLFDYQRAGSHASLGLARITVEDLLRDNPHDADALTLLAYVQQGEHDFGRARNTLREVLALTPHNDEARLLLATVSLVGGDVATARASCRALRAASAAVIIGCFASTALADDQAEQAYPKVARLLTNVPVGTTAATRAWLLAIAGDLAMALGRHASAVHHYAESLVLAERAQVRAALFDAHLANGDRDGARATAISSASLALQVRALMVAEEVERTHRVAHAHEQFCEWIAEEDWTHAREMARFYLDVLPRPNLARALAAVNLRHQREPEDLRLARRSGAVGAKVDVVGCSS